MREGCVVLWCGVVWCDEEDGKTYGGLILSRFDVIWAAIVPRIIGYHSTMLLEDIQQNFLVHFPFAEEKKNNKIK